jgi:hypothetical protein
MRREAAAAGDADCVAPRDARARMRTTRALVRSREMTSVVATDREATAVAVDEGRRRSGGRDGSRRAPRDATEDGDGIEARDTMIGTGTVRIVAAIVAIEGRGVGTTSAGRASAGRRRRRFGRRGEDIEGFTQRVIRGWRRWWRESWNRR